MKPPTTATHEPADGVVLEARTVTVDFHSRQRHTRALDGVSLAIASGEAVGLIGESGSGKTTLSRTLLGLVPPTNGTVLYRDRPIYAMKSLARHRLLGRDTAMVFQDPQSSLNPRLSVEAVIRDPLRVQRIGGREEQRVRVMDLLKRVGLPSQMAHRPVRALSGGQLQRVALARALAVEPAVIVADEPTSALDVSVQAQILNLIQEIRSERQLALLVVSHDVRVIRFLADRTAVMYGGELVEEGATEEVYESPKHDYTRSLLSAAPTLSVG